MEGPVTPLEIEQRTGRWVGDAEADDLAKDDGVVDAEFEEVSDDKKSA